MARLDSKERKALPTKDFAGPDRSYPINDASHARNALARVSQFGSPAEKSAVRAKVASKFPGIGQRGDKSEPPKGRGSSERSAAGPREDSADRKGDGMRPMSPTKQAGKHNGRGHMGDWADKMHPVGRS